MEENTRSKRIKSAKRGYETAYLIFKFLLVLSIISLSLSFISYAPIFAMFYNTWSSIRIYASVAPLIGLLMLYYYDRVEENVNIPRGLTFFLVVVYILIHLLSSGYLTYERIWNCDTDNACFDGTLLVHRWQFSWMYGSHLASLICTLVVAFAIYQFQCVRERSEYNRISVITEAATERGTKSVPATESGPNGVPMKTRARDRLNQLLNE
jgi:hypothetical protein